MKGFWIIFFWFGITCLSQDLNFYRENYAKASSDKSLCSRVISSLEKSNKSNLEWGYYGAYQTIWANHAVNPLSKLSSFQKGKKNLEHAIAKDPTNMELRALRLSIQINAPKFLGYHNAIENDKSFLKKHKNSVQDPFLKNLIDQLL